jgi:hypothetical protein
VGGGEENADKQYILIFCSSRDHKFGQFCITLQLLEELPSIFKEPSGLDRDNQDTNEVAE